MGNEGMSAVDHPEHYTSGDVECIDAIHAALGDEGFAQYMRGNVIKYVWRYPQKGGIQDLRKAQWYLNRLVELVSGSANGTETIVTAQWTPYGGGVMEDDRR